ncbi:VCBS repeat-containing protein [Deferribacter autotrophicus]|uniref:VCBS repeat-containing protein n=1 Tax=Deferribacter autotrophicus TaxID=500465 RepID=A0A5A8F439_9BACT|nr:VCBS repeat-containing protein [Deferribacter autotrophicus]KAA0258331.1 VCBS repeat-containing protein [Deferribacter autotrophicus]
MLKRFFVILFLLVPLVSFARFEKLVGEIDNLLAPVKGYVVAVEGDTVYTDLTKEDGVTRGRVLNVYREGKKIVHPITGEVLGVKRSYLGKVKIIEVFDKYSIASVFDKKEDFRKGDVVISETPVKVKVNYENFNRRLELLMKQDLADATNFIVSDSGNYLINFVQDEKGGIEYMIFFDGKLIAKKYYADVNLSYLSKGKPSLMTADILRSKPIDKELRTISVGHIFNDDYEYIVTADEDTVYIYKFTGDDFEYVTRIDGDFDEILNVETIDLNGNGIDEIFISNLQNGRNIKSAIYEFDDNKPKLLKRSIPYIFRTIMVNGHKKLVCQRISRDGEYLGKIHYYEYKADYVRGDAIDGTNGIGIFGFGYGDIDNDGKKEILYLNKQFRLIIIKDGKKIFKSHNYFGKTPYYFMLENEKKVKKEYINRNEDDPFEILHYKKFLKGRVYVYDGGKIYILKNEQVSDVLPNLLKFKGSVFEGLIWQRKMIRKIWESDTFKPTIVDYYGEERFGKNYVVLLRNFGSGLFKGTKSEFIYLEVK